MCMFINVLVHIGIYGYVPICTNMRVKIITGLILLVYMTGIAMAAEEASPFDLGNAKVFWDDQSDDFHKTFLLVIGAVFFVVGTVLAASLIMNAASFAAQKSGSFEDPTKKSGSATNMIGIVLMCFGAILCLYVVLPVFGF